MRLKKCTLKSPLASIWSRTAYRRRAILLACLIMVFHTVRLTAQFSFVAVDDSARTGPMQTVSIDVIHNDTILCSNYTWRIISTLNANTEGTVVKNGDKIVFTPGKNCRDRYVDIVYGVSCSGTEVTATLSVFVMPYNLPANVIDSKVPCYDPVPTNIPFGIRLKYRTAGATNNTTSISEHYGIDGFTSPMVGDLNGDGKPEIVVMGTKDQSTAGGKINQTSIVVFNGQTGGLKHMAILGNSGAPTGSYFTGKTSYLNLGGSFQMGAPYHRAPSSLAIAQLDSANHPDKSAEIIYCHAKTGKIYAFTPVFNGENITGFTKKWESSVSFKSDNNPTTRGNFGYPHPYVADLNGDGIPEIIVYNKIYNGRTGALLLTWGGVDNPSPQTQYTSNSPSGTLVDRSYPLPSTSANAVNIRSVPMTGRRPLNSTADSYSDRDLAVPAIIDIDGDGQQEIITGIRIYKFQFNSLTDHTQNTYTMIDGPHDVTISEGGSNKTHYLSDGHTRVADIDGDGQLDVVVTCGVYGDYWDLEEKILLYAWNPQNKTMKGAATFYSDGDHGGFGIPFIGDINGKNDGWDGSAYTRKLPEICIIGGFMRVNSGTNFGGRSGMDTHTLAGTELKSKDLNTDNHILGITYDAKDSKFKVSWAMGHTDDSNSTGITLFDFDNNNAMDLCYRDQTTLRVISPKRSGKDYVPKDETENSPNTSIMFRTKAPSSSESGSVCSATGFEFPVIADINMDGSADIIVAGTPAGYNAVGVVYAFEYNGSKFAPCPPVWNQSMYDPLQVSEDLRINARPQSMLTEYVKNGETIRPYNGSWIQQPIVREGSGYAPIARKPDAYIWDVDVHVVNTTQTEVNLVIKNIGSSSINANTPITFYDGGAKGSSTTISGATWKTSNMTVGVDIFPNETVTKTFIINGRNFNDRLIWVRIMDNGGTQFPVPGYPDCDTSNNYGSGADCPYLKYTVVADPDTIICVSGGNVTLWAAPTNAPDMNFRRTFQWYRNEMPIFGETDSSYVATQPGDYACFVTEDICRMRTPAKKLVYGVLPDVNILKVWNDYDAVGDSMRVYVRFSNSGLALKAPFYLSLKADYGSTPFLAGLDSIMSVINAGQTVTASVTMRNVSSKGIPSHLRNLTVYLNNRGTWTKFIQPECTFDNNTETIKPIGVFNDVQTAQAYRWAEIDVLANDTLPSGYPTDINVVTMPVSGTVMVVGAGTTSQLVYQNTGTATLSGQVDSFRYSLTYVHPEQGTVTRTATAYIYILEDMDGASACYGKPYTIRLRKRPTNMTFEWFAASNPTSPFQTTDVYSLGAQTSDASWYIRPVDPNTSARWNRTAGAFPAGLFTLHVNPVANSLLRWTGGVSSDWKDPQNWVERVMVNGVFQYESPVEWSPSPCEKVEIASDATFFPELTDGRAMLKNPHLLKYDSVTIEFVPLAVERDRYMTLSAPLKQTYSGDYHFKNSQNNPQWGDVYMNFFSRANPDNGAMPPSSNVFTASFGRPDMNLELGMAFNLRIVTTTETRNKPFIFPQKATEYRVTNNGVTTAYPVTRNRSSYRFITSDVVMRPDTTFALPVATLNVGQDLVQIVNPYLAYLDVEKFLKGNVGTLSQAGYLIWDGDPRHSFAPSNPYVYEKGLIAPLQSFFVQKLPPNSNNLTSVWMSPNWTTTQGRHPYVLRTDAVKTGILRIRAVQRENVGETLLCYHKDASPDYQVNEDIQTLFFDENPLTLYSYARTSSHTPLAANVSGNFMQQPIPLGLRLMEAGEVRLEFSGLETFGHRVYLHDREQGNERIDLIQHPVYTFIVNKPQSARIVELNDRFTLTVEYTGEGLDVASEKKPSTWTATTKDGMLHVHAEKNMIRSLEVYTAAGALIHRTQSSMTEYRIPVEHGQVYIVKAGTSTGVEIKKVMGRK